MAEERTHTGLRGRDLAGLGGLLVAGVVGGMVIGLLVDQAAGTEPVWTLVGVSVGVVLGVVGFVVRVREALRE